MVIDSVWAWAEALIQGAAWLPPYFNLPPALYCLGILATEKTACYLSYGNQCFFWKEVGWQRGVLLMSFHFQPVSFSLEALPCRSPCPLATDVWQEKRSGVVLWIVVCHLFLLSLCFFYAFFFLFLFFLFFFFTLNQAAKKARGRKKWHKEINTEAQSDPVASMRVSWKHLWKGIWVAEERDQNVSSHFWSCQFKVPTERRGVGGGRGEMVAEGGTDT